MNSNINTLRHLQNFDPDEFGDRQINVIGAGAVGSKVTMQLAKLGVENIHVFDPDEVEGHNIPNQEFGIDDIGALKVQALKERVDLDTGLLINDHAEYVTEDNIDEFGLQDVVFLLTDTMASRREIFEAGLEYNFDVDMVVETRMDADNYRVYVFDPNDPDHIDAWTGTLYTDEEAVDQPSEDEEDGEGTACNVSQSVGPTSSMLAGHAVWQVIRYQQNGHSAPDEYNQQIVGVPPLTSHRSDF